MAARVGGHRTADMCRAVHAAHADILDYPGESLADDARRLAEALAARGAQEDLPTAAPAPPDGLAPDSRERGRLRVDDMDSLYCRAALRSMTSSFGSIWHLAPAR